MHMKILLTGVPGIGKSTIVDYVVKHTARRVYGTVGKEVLDEKKERVGFEAVALDSSHRTFAHLNEFVDSPFQIGPFHVDVKAFDEFCVPELRKALSDDGSIVIIDEIGRMQAFSEIYMQTVRDLLNSQADVLATIVYDDEPWSREFKQHPEVIMITVTQDNRNELEKIVSAAIENAQYYNQLSEKQQSAVRAWFVDCVNAKKFIQAFKLMFNTLQYVATGAITHATENEYHVTGKTKPHVVRKNNNGTFMCDCDLFLGQGEFMGKSGECSHIFAARLLEA